MEKCPASLFSAIPCCFICKVFGLPQEHRILEDQVARDLSESPNEHQVNVFTFSDWVKWVRGCWYPKWPHFFLLWTQKPTTKELYHILSYSCHFLYSPTTNAKSDGIEGKGKTGQSLVTFPFNLPYSLIQRQKVVVKRVQQEVKLKRFSEFCAFPLFL